MQTRSAFAHWSRLHADLLVFLAQVPDSDLERFGPWFRHIAEVEDYWRRTILEPLATMVPLAARDREALRSDCERIFGALERLLDSSRLDALCERPVKSSYPVKNALEALSLCHLHTVHHRANIASELRAAGVAIEEWI